MRRVSVTNAHYYTYESTTTDDAAGGRGTGYGGRRPSLPFIVVARAEVQTCRRVAGIAGRCGRRTTMLRETRKVGKRWSGRKKKNKGRCRPAAVYRTVLHAVEYVAGGREGLFWRDGSVVVVISRTGLPHTGAGRNLWLRTRPVITRNRARARDSRAHTILLLSHRETNIWPNRGFRAPADRAPRPGNPLARRVCLLRRGGRNNIMFIVGIKINMASRETFAFPVKVCGFFSHLLSS